MTDLRPPPVPPPAPASPPARRDSSAGITALAGLGAAFAGLLSHGRNPDLLTTSIAVGITFAGAFVGLHLLRLLLRLVAAVGKVAIPVAALLLIGCALDWPWAQTAVDWLSVVGGQGVEAAERGWVALRTQ